MRNESSRVYPGGRNDSYAWIVASSERSQKVFRLLVNDSDLRGGISL